MYLLFFDTETTGLNTKEDEILELGYAVYHIDNPAPVLLKSDFIVNQKKQITPEIEEITGITDAIIQKSGRPGSEVYQELADVIAKYDIQYAIGHNAYDFDIKILAANMEFYEITLPKLTVIDTLTDVKYRTKSKSYRLSYLLADHGFINPFPHRALTDAMSCAMLLYQYDIRQAIAVASTPIVEIKADVERQNKDLAKALQYQWDPERKIWFKKIRQYYLLEEVKKAKFRVVELQKAA